MSRGFPHTSGSQPSLDFLFFFFLLCVCISGTIQLIAVSRFLLPASVLLWFVRLFSFFFFSSSHTCGVYSIS